MNETVKNILARRSVRAYTDKLVSDEDLKTIVDCGLYAATAMGKQPWHITVVKSRAVLDEIAAANKEVLLNSPDEHLRKMAEAPDFDNFRGAPMALILSAEKEQPFGEVDCANAAENMAVAAWSMGIASCYIASFRAGMGGPKGAELCGKLGIPEGYAPYFALSLGYAAAGEPKEPRAPRREGTVNVVE